MFDLIFNYNIYYYLQISDDAIPILADLTRLKRLDISRNSDFASRLQQQVYLLFDHFVAPPQSLSINELLSKKDALPELEHLDISGCERIDVETLTSFVKKRSANLRFLGLLDCEACYESFFRDRVCKTLVVSKIIL